MLVYANQFIVIHYLNFLVFIMVTGTVVGWESKMFPSLYMEIILFPQFVLVLPWLRHLLIDFCDALGMKPLSEQAEKGEKKSLQQIGWQ